VVFGQLKAIQPGGYQLLMHWLALMRSTGYGYLRIAQAKMPARTTVDQIDSKQRLESRSREYQLLDITPAMQNITSIITDHCTAKMPTFYNVITRNFNQELIGHIYGILQSETATGATGYYRRSCAVQCLIR
jgi:hypothetical protein